MISSSVLIVIAAQVVVSLLSYFRYEELSLLTTHDVYGLSIVEIYRRDSYNTKLYKLRKIKMMQVRVLETISVKPARTCFCQCRRHRVGESLLGLIRQTKLQSTQIKI